MLGSCPQPLVDAYDLAMFDLDGVVYIGEDAVPGAPAHLARARELGVHLAFITNNASRPPEAVVEKLAGIGVEASVADVVTSAQAAARVLSDRYGAGAFVAVLGAAGLEEALRAEGLEPVAVTDDRAVALVTGYGPDVRLARRDASGGPSPRRPAVGGQQRRPVAADAVRPGARTRGDGGPARAVQRRPGRRGRQAAAPAAGRDGPPRGRRAPADDRRPARHRHRGRARGRGGLAAGADRRDRAGRPGGGRAAAAADVPVGRPGRPLRGARGARAGRRRLGLGWLAGAGGRRRLEVSGDGRPGRLVARGGERRLGAPRPHRRGSGRRRTGRAGRRRRAAEGSLDA